MVLDPTLRVLQVDPVPADRGDIAALLGFLDGLPPPARFAGFELQAPVLVLPNVFEPEFCRQLIGLYEKHGGEESGFMREVDGKTVGDARPRAQAPQGLHDRGRRSSSQALQARVQRRVVPEIAQGAPVQGHAHGALHRRPATRPRTAAHFRAHRDNTTKGTAHRRFAVSINLNDEFDGGEVSFPEYGPRSFKPPAGGAVVFSCSLLHAVSTVTRGRRYAFLPFLYDDAAAKIREENARYLEDPKQGYRAGPE